MRTILAVAALAAGAILPVPAAAAPSPAASESGQHVTVNGDRRICRTVRRTASRMGQGRICRTESQWAESGSSVTREYRSLDAAAQALAVLSNASTTGCGLTPP